MPNRLPTLLFYLSKPTSEKSAVATRRFPTRCRVKRANIWFAGDLEASSLRVPVKRVCQLGFVRFASWSCVQCSVPEYSRELLDPQQGFQDTATPDRTNLQKQCGCGLSNQNENWAPMENPQGGAHADDSRGARFKLSRNKMAQPHRVFMGSHDYRTGMNWGLAKNPPIGPAVDWPGGMPDCSLL